MVFPQYRKYANNQKYFKILSDLEWEEISFIGKRSIKSTHKATILPDRNFIADLINDVPNFCEMITEEEYSVNL